jgi:hypothetical protein
MPQGIPFGFFSEISSVSTLDLPTDLGLMSHLNTWTCSECIAASATTFTGVDQIKKLCRQDLQ